MCALLKIPFAGMITKLRASCVPKHDLNAKLRSNLCRYAYIYELRIEIFMYTVDLVESAEDVSLCVCGCFIECVEWRVDDVIPSGYF